MADRDTGKIAQRLDKWLWHARIVKTRSVAAQLVTQGKFKVNRERVIKPATMVKCGDVITMAVFGRVRVLKIEGFSERRGPATEARTLYADLTPAADAAPGESEDPDAAADSKPPQSL